MWYLGAVHTAAREDPGRATADRLSPDLSTGPRQLHFGTPTWPAPISKG
jgi:hypothetical protein